MITATRIFRESLLPGVMPRKAILWSSDTTAHLLKVFHVTYVVVSSDHRICPMGVETRLGVAFASGH